MITDIILKIRSLIGDLGESDFEVFSYTNSSVFTISEPNINTIEKVLLNGTELTVTTDYTYDSATNKVTITATLSDADIIEVDYTYYKYSDTEIKGYIRGALVYISIGSYNNADYELDVDDIYPTPNNRTTDLISLVSAILIKPDYTEYRLPNRTVKYHQRLPKEEKIEKLVDKFNIGLGVTGVLEID